MKKKSTKKKAPSNKLEGGMQGEAGHVQARLDFVRSCLGQGQYDHEVLDACVDSALFLFRTKKPKTKKNKTSYGVESKDPKQRRLTRGTIKEKYLYRIRREWRLNLIDPKEELQKGYDRFMESFRMAVKQEDPKAMAMAQRYLAKMLGLNGAQDGASFSAEQVVAQLKAMKASVGK